MGFDSPIFKNAFDMKLLNFAWLLCLLIGLHQDCLAQSGVNISTPAYDDSYSEFSAILHNGKILAQRGVDGPLILEPNMTGKLSVSTIRRKNMDATPEQAIGFKIAIKNMFNNTVWLFSEETFYEIDIEYLLKDRKLTDRVIFMVADKKYRLPRHELMLSDGC